jgi:hypothetical protein
MRVVKREEEKEKNETSNDLIIAAHKMLPTTKRSAY